MSFFNKDIHKLHFSTVKGDLHMTTFAFTEKKKKTLEITENFCTIFFYIFFLNREKALFIIYRMKMLNELTLSL